MDDIKREVMQLASNWSKLSAGLKKSKKIDFELFNQTFTKTYTLLAQQSAESSLDRIYINLIVNASLFANADIAKLDSKYSAAIVLTERMINQAISGNYAISGGAQVYILTSRQDVLIDFNDIDGSIETLSKFFEADFWKKQIYQ